MPDQLPAYTREELDERARNLIRSRRRGADVSLGSDFDIWARMLGALAWGIQKHGEIAFKLLDQTKSFGTFLRQYALENGVGRGITGTSTAAVKATGKVILRSTTASQMQASGSVLRHADGAEYTLDANATTSATAAKTLLVGHRSGRRRLNQGSTSGTFVTAVQGEVYRFSPTGEYVALKDVENASTLQRYLFDLYNDLDVDPEIHDQFAQQFGVVGSITASKPGARGNKDAKDVLAVVSPAGTIQAEATILYLRDGADDMPPSAMQEALRLLFAERGGTGTVDDIRAIAKGYPGIDVIECYVTPGANGIGTYGLLPVSADGSYIGASELTAVKDYVADRVSPVDKLFAAAVYEEIDSAITRIDVLCGSTLEPDWSLSDQASEGITVTTPGTSSIDLFSVDDIAIGDRVIVTDYGTTHPPYIVQRRVTSLAGLTIGLDSPLPHPPGNAVVTPGGPLGQRIIDAIYAAYEQRSPSADQSGVQLVRFPAPTVSDDKQAIASAVAGVDGVIDCSIRGGSPASLPNAGGLLVPACAIRMYV